LGKGVVYGINIVWDLEKRVGQTLKDKPGGEGVRGGRRKECNETWQEGGWVSCGLG